MATKTIQFTLDVSSIAQAISQVEKYRDDLQRAVYELVRRLTEEGREAAVLNILRLGAFETGQLAGEFGESIHGAYNDTTHIGIIRTDCWYAVFVEYGTGVVGAGSPHPGPWDPVPVSWNDRVYTQYDTYGHGESGWWYYNEYEGRVMWTKGQPSRPFFYQMYMQMVQLAEQAFNNLQI